MRKPTTPDEMRVEAARLREYVARLNQASERASANAPGAFVTGASGRTAVQNRATDRALEKTIANAVKAVAATKQADELEREADYIESGGPAKLAARIATRRTTEAADFKADKAALRAGPLEDRLFSGNYPCAVVYADRAVERGGDYRPLAMLPYDTLQMIYEKDCPDMWRPLLEQKAAAMQTRVGEQYQVSTCGQYVILGSKILKERTEDHALPLPIVHH